MKQSLRSFAQLVILIQISLSTSVQALDVCKRQKLLELIEQTRGPTFLSQDDKIKINSFFDDPALSPEMRARAAFDVVLEARLKLLHSQDAEEIRKVLQNVSVSRSVEGHSSGYFTEPNLKKGTLQKIVIELPAGLEESVEQFNTLIHEIEHAVQYHFLGSQEFHPYLFNAIDVERRFLTEKGAMQAEWNYIASIPFEVREELVKTITADKSINTATKKLMSRTLLTLTPDSETYVLSEWRAGRYTKNEIQLISFLYSHGFIPSFSMLITWLIWEDLKVLKNRAETDCLLALDAVHVNPARPPLKDWFVKLCERFPSFVKLEAEYLKH